MNTKTQYTNLFRLTDRKKEILKNELCFQYSRSSGPGGQKVNKTETRVEARLNIPESQAFTDNQKQRLIEKLGSRINREGELVLFSEKFRSRLQNKKQVFLNLCKEIQEALTQPKPRKKTKSPKVAVETRLKDKKKQSEKKKNREKGLRQEP